MRVGPHLFIALIISIVAGCAGSRSAAPVAGAPTAAPQPSPAERLIADGRLVEARTELIRQLNQTVDATEAAALRHEIARVNAKLLFSPTLYPNDPLTEVHFIEPGDTLAELGERYHVPWRLIWEINGKPDTTRLLVGARWKMIRGPFHARANLAAGRLDLYLQGALVRSFAIDGADPSFPVGRYAIERYGMRENPGWMHPRTGERFEAGAPDNPIGRYWIGISRDDGRARRLNGYGLGVPAATGREPIEGVIELDEDAMAELFELMSPGESEVIVERSAPRTTGSATATR